MSIVQEIWDRRFAQYVAAYTAVAWGVLQVVDQLVDRGVLGDLWYRLALVLFIAGFPASMIISWYHGARDDQKVTRREVWLLGFVGVLTLATGGWVVRSYEPSDPTSVARRLRAAALERIPESEDPRRIAVLYMQPRSVGEDVPFLAAGLTETLISQLDAVDELDVVSRHGVAPYRGQGATVDSIGRALRVGTVVDGTVAASGGEIRVNVALLNPATGEMFGRAIVQRPRRELFALQDDLAHEVAVFLRARIGEELDLITREEGLENVEAWELLQRARAVRDNVGELLDAGDSERAWDRLGEADSLLAEAEGLAPEWVDPTIERGWIAWRRSRWRGATERTEAARWIDEGLEHSEVALNLAANDPDALELRGTLRYWRHQLDVESNPEAARRLLERAEADLREAVALNPGQAGAWATLVHVTNVRGDLAGARIAALRAYQADAYLREADVILWRLFTSAYDLADQPEAKHWCEELGRRFPDDPRFMECRLWYMTMPGAETDVDLAWDLAETLVDLTSSPETAEADRRWGHLTVAAVLARAGLTDSARAVAARSGHVASLDPTHDLTYAEAFVRTIAGDHEEANRLLATYMAATGAGPSSIDHWWFEDLQGTVGYERLLTVPEER